ncbi:TauD/TfdA family dioxygenase [Micromonospora chalcea]|uniref:TauD/TfdA family dioxygenase n=1 Tax=Micromonospora chalcea TaxID=1874 RepID=UPI0038159EA5
MPPLEPYRPAGQRPLLQWAADSIDDIRSRLRTNGALWLRGFDSAPPNSAQELLALLAGELMDDVFFSTPRSSVADKTFTATEYPCDQRIPLHSEMSYLTRWPRLLCFHALRCPPNGGQTSVSDLGAVSADLGELAAKFLDREVRYIRVFHPGLDIPITTAFGTNDLDEIAVIAAAHGMTLETGKDASPRLTYTAQGALRDSLTGAAVWFNQAAVHHPARLPAATRAALTQMYGADGLPRQATYGDGEAIPDDTIHAISNTFNRHAQLIDWEPGDVVLLDNLRYAHGREPYAGARAVHVAMALPCAGVQREPLFPSK